jgi:hypothetical protein
VGFRDTLLRADNAARDLLGGVVVSYQAATGAAVPVSAIVDEMFSVQVPGAEMGVEENTIAIWCVVAELPAHPDDDDPEITIEGSDLNPVRERPVTFTVRHREYDGAGSVKLWLHEKDCS